MKKLCGKYSVTGCVFVIVLYSKVETGSGYPGNCNRVPGS